MVIVTTPKDVDYAKIGQRVRTLRLEKRLTQAELADMVDCSNNYLSHIETAQCKLSLGVLLRIALALETSVDYFLLDTPFARPKAIINDDISKKLSRCNSSTLITVSKLIDVLLEQQERQSIQE